MAESPLVRAWEWISQRPLHLTGMRVYDQVARRVTGAPLQHYSQITPQLHIGGQHDARGMAALQERGITAVVNLRKRHDDEKSGAAPDRYLHLPVRDNTAPTQEQLHEGVNFITQQIEEGGAVYVHCGVGVGRASTLAAAYLVSTGMTPAEAWAKIRAVRPFIWPNRRQRASVTQFAETEAVRNK